jgi:hypothetical protein
LQVLQPVAQVPSEFGSLHVGTLGPTGPGTTQHNWPSSQQLDPQQNCAPSHDVAASHGGSPQTPSLHDSPGMHWFSQLPQ